MALGRKTGGRQPGSGNKSLAFDVAFIAKRMHCDPFEIMAMIANGELPCNVCRGKGTTKYQPSRATRIVDGMRVLVMDATENGEARLKERPCLSCYGSGKEQIPPETRGRYAAELANYCAPKRKAIEHSGEGGGPIQHVVQVKYVE